jgi:hypothetical protein
MTDSSSTTTTRTVRGNGCAPVTIFLLVAALGGFLIFALVVLDSTTNGFSHWPRLPGAQQAAEDPPQTPPCCPDPSSEETTPTPPPAPAATPPPAPSAPARFDPVDGYRHVFRRLGPEEGRCRVAFTSDSGYTDEEKVAINDELCPGQPGADRRYHVDVIR